jgi:small subunit ribosomal protein S17
MKQTKQEKTAKKEAGSARAENNKASSSKDEGKKASSSKDEGKKASSSKDEGNLCDESCPIHGSLSARGRLFQGTVKKKFPKRAVIEFERTLYVKKYERYVKKKTKIHARLPKCMESEIQIGDYVQVQECRPLSKIIHFVIIKKIRDKAGSAKAENNQGKMESKE